MNPGQRKQNTQSKKAINFSNAINVSQITFKLLLQRP